MTALTPVGLIPIAVSEYDLGWIVGILEGEGTFVLLRSGGGRRYYSQVGVTQKDPWLLYRFIELLGCGHISLDSDRVYRWYIRGGKARELIRLVMPYLSPRRQKQAQRALNDGTIPIVPTCRVTRFGT